MNPSPRNKEGRLLVALVSAAIWLTIAGCSTPSAGTASSGAANPPVAADGAASGSASQPPLTKSDLNPAMSDAQKAAALQRKNR